MISFNVGNDKFNYRVSGIFADKDGKRFLTNTAPDIDFFVLPGGRVDMGEDSREALKREVQEELGVNVEVGSLKAIIENFFEFDGKNYHELQFVYVGTILDEDILSKQTTFLGPEKKDIYKWIHLDEFDELNYRPEMLKTPIKEAMVGDYTFRHLIHKGNG